MGETSERNSVRSRDRQAVVGEVSGIPARFLVQASGEGFGELGGRFWEKIVKILDVLRWRTHETQRCLEGSWPDGPGAENRRIDLGETVGICLSTYYVPGTRATAMRKTILWREGVVRRMEQQKG